jgi:uncharacterized protein
MEMILDPTILFFCLGVLAVWFKSNIEIPPQTTKFLSYYLLMSIGFKGGIALAKENLTTQIFLTMGAGALAAILVPLIMFFILRRKLDNQNAAGIAACYGSVSAVTFLTGVSWLENRGLSYGGHMVAVIAMMDTPAIVVGLMLSKIFAKNNDGLKFSLRTTLHDAFFNGSIFILLGSLGIGYIMNPAKAHDYQVFVYDIFKGFLCFFLLDLGMSAARQLKELKSNAIFLTTVALVAPIVNSMVGLILAKLLNLSVENGFLLMIMTASSSYIAVPAALKTNLPEASPSMYLSMSLGLTFPFNILLGMPVYWNLAQRFLG